MVLPRQHAHADARRYAQLPRVPLAFCASWRRKHSAWANVRLCARSCRHCASGDGDNSKRHCIVQLQRRARKCGTASMCKAVSIVQLGRLILGLRRRIALLPAVIRTAGRTQRMRINGHSTRAARMLRISVEYRALRVAKKHCTSSTAVCQDSP